MRQPAARIVTGQPDGQPRHLAAAVTASVLVAPQPRGEGRSLRTTLHAKLA